MQTDYVSVKSVTVRLNPLVRMEKIVANFLRCFIIIYGLSGLFGTQFSLAQTESGWGRDPFKSPMAKVKEEKDKIVKAKPPLSLSAIMQGKEKLAIINGEVLGIGEIIEGRKIIEVDENKVVLIDDDGKKEELIMEEDIGF